MPCRADPCPHLVGPLKPDYHNQHDHQPQQVYSPTTKQELIFAVQDIERLGLKARAIGTDMALSHAGYTDDAAIATDGLDRHVLLPFGASASNLDDKRLRKINNAINPLDPCVSPDVRARGPKLLFVEGGMKIHQLLQDLPLMSPALALPAMGAGGRQSIVGALATGTHGSEVDRQPLIDAIRAVYLVGPGGQEWWIERSNGWSDRAQLAATIPDWCPDTQVEYDDVLFYSALVGVGRLGVIYAVVLEVEPDYWLVEQRTPDGIPWAPVEAALQASIASGYGPPSGIFYTRGPLSFLQIALNPNDLTTCWTVERRRQAPAPGTEQGLTKNSVDAVSLFCKPSAPAWMAIEPAIDLVMTPALTALAAASPGVFPDPGLATLALLAAGWVDSQLDWIKGVFRRSANLGEALGTILGQFPSLTGPLTGLMIGMDHKVNNPNGNFKVGSADEVLDQVDYSKPLGCYMGVGSEYHFNARAGGFLSFVHSISQFAQGLGGIPGYMSLRFVPQTDAYIGMERFPLTVAIELSCLTPWPTADTYLMTAQSMAIAAGGLPHWGLKLYEPIGTPGLYKSALDAYHLAVATIEDGHPSTFSSPFSATEGLDPPPLSAARAAAGQQVSILALMAAAQGLIPSAPPVATVRAAARRYAPSLRMNPDHDPLPLALAARSDHALSVRDLARRLI